MKGRSNSSMIYRGNMKEGEEETCWIWLCKWVVSLIGGMWRSYIVIESDKNKHSPQNKIEIKGYGKVTTWYTHNAPVSI